jgi:hypothetical protein
MSDITKREKSIIKEITNNLEKSTKKNWHSGDLDDWATFANKMSVTINQSISILRILSNETDEE